MTGPQSIERKPEAEFQALTNIGNQFHIRHFETDKVELDDEIVDYLFLRAYTLLDAAVRAIADTTE